MNHGPDNPDNSAPSETAAPEADLLALYAPVYDVVRAIPPGKVMTYGQVADAVTSISVTARQVGTALRYIPDDVPWQRVVGAGGHLPIAKRSPEAKLLQRRLLTQEGATFLERDPDRVDMPRSQWLPDAGHANSVEEQGSLFDDGE
jgi:methylated-DNA-protein-cysteine methyltransferase-like protein